jgi:hypothetical protein
MVGVEWVEGTYYGIEHVGHLYFFGWAWQMPHTFSTMLKLDMRSYIDCIWYDVLVRK